MALDSLLAKLEGRTVTSVTAANKLDVTPNPAPSLACTPVTPVTSRNDDSEIAGKPSTGDHALFDFGSLTDPASDAEALASRSRTMLAAVPPTRRVDSGWAYRNEGGNSR
jgi:hypothetical protein